MTPQRLLREALQHEKRVRALRANGRYDLALMVLLDICHLQVDALNTYAHPAIGRIVKRLELNLPTENNTASLDDSLAQLARIEGVV